VALVIFSVGRQVSDMASPYYSDLAIGAAALLLNLTKLTTESV
jgi:hypothetical protein